MIPLRTTILTKLFNYELSVLSEASSPRSVIEETANKFQKKEGQSNSKTGFKFIMSLVPPGWDQ